jgi:ABC-2 type transport system ATP-binding protein
MVRGQSKAGVSVVVSSHILHELEEMADRVVFMEWGRCHSTYSMDELPVAEGLRSWRIKALNYDVLEAVLHSWGRPFERQPNRSIVLEVTSEAEAAELATALVGQGVSLVEFAPQHGTIERAFLSMAREAEA